MFAIGAWTSICGSLSKISCLGTICCVYLRRPSSTERESGLGWTVVLSPLVLVLRRPSWDQLLESGHACLQRRLCQQLHQEEWKRRLATRGPPWRLRRHPSSRWANSQPNSESVGPGKATRRQVWLPRELVIFLHSRNVPRPRGIPRMRARCVTVELQQRSIESGCSPCGLRAGEDRASQTRRWLWRVGCRDAAPAPAPASLRSPPRRVFRKLVRRRKCKRRKRVKTGNERRYACSPGGEEASWVSLRIHHRLVRPPDQVRSGHRRTGSSSECTAPSGEPL